MTFTKRLRDRIRSGEITCTVRFWISPRVTVGKRYQMEEGQIEVDSIEPIGLPSRPNPDPCPAVAIRNPRREVPFCRGEFRFGSNIALPALRDVHLRGVALVSTAIGCQPIHRGGGPILARD